MAVNSFREDEDVESKSKSATMLRLFSYLLAYKWKIVGVLALMLVTVVITLINPLLIEEAIDNYISKGNTPSGILLPRTSCPMAQKSRPSRKCCFLMIRRPPRSTLISAWKTSKRLMKKAIPEAGNEARQLCKLKTQTINKEAATSQPQPLGT